MSKNNKTIVILNTKEIQDNLSISFWKKYGTKVIVGKDDFIAFETKDNKIIQSIARSDNLNKLADKVVKYYGMC